MDGLLSAIGPGTLQAFVSRWHGPAPASPPGRDGGRDGDGDGDGRDLPDALRRWYAATSGRPWADEGPFVVLPPQELAVADGKLVVVREAQDVYEWGCDVPAAGVAGSGDPPVHERATVDGEPWHPTGVGLSGFLLGVAVVTTVLTAEHQAAEGDLTRATLDGILRPLAPLPVPGPTLHTRLHADAGADVLAFTGPDVGGDETPDDGTRWWLYLAARTADRLDAALAGR